MARPTTRRRHLDEGPTGTDLEGHGVGGTLEPAHQRPDVVEGVLDGVE